MFQKLYCRLLKRRFIQENGNLNQHLFGGLNFRQVPRYLNCVGRLLGKNHKLAFIALLLLNKLYRHDNINSHDKNVVDAFEILVNDSSNSPLTCYNI